MTGRIVIRTVPGGGLRGGGSGHAATRGAAPAMLRERGAEQYEHMGRGFGRAIFGFRVVSHVRSGTGASVRGSLSRTRHALPVVPLRLNLSRPFGRPAALSHRALTVRQDPRSDVTPKFRSFAVSFAAHGPNHAAGAAVACAEKLSLRVRK